MRQTDFVALLRKMIYGQASAMSRLSSTSGTRRRDDSIRLCGGAEKPRAVSGMVDSCGSRTTNSLPWLAPALRTLTLPPCISTGAAPGSGRFPVRPASDRASGWPA